MSRTPNYELAARRAALKHGVDPDIFVAQLRQESGLRPGQTSSAGAQGIAQFIPSTAAAYGVNLHDGRVSDDLDGAARYMRDNLKRTGGSYEKALSIYNSGRPDGYLRYGETKAYVKGILNGRRAQPLPRAGKEQRAQRRLETRHVAEKTDYEAALVDSLLSRRKGQSLLGAALAAADSGAYTTPARTERVLATAPAHKPPHPSTARPKPSGGWGGTEGLLIPFSRKAHRLGLTTTSAKRSSSPAGGAGTASDHHVSQHDASARDWSGSVENMRRLSRDIATQLGVKNFQYGGPDINVVIDGYRYQLITRPHGTGPHVHLGVRRVR